MDIILLAVLTGTALGAIGLSYAKDSAYLGVLGGIVLILCGLGMSFDINITTTFCNGNATVSTDCFNTPVAMPPQPFGYGLGAIFMLAGVGAVVDALIGWNTEKEEFIPSKEVEQDFL